MGKQRSAAAAVNGQKSQGEKPGEKLVEKPARGSLCERWRCAAVLCAFLVTAGGVVLLTRRGKPREKYRTPKSAPESARMLWKFGVWQTKKGKADIALTSLFRAQQVLEHSDSLASPFGVGLLGEIIRTMRSDVRRGVHEEAIPVYQEIIRVLMTVAPEDRDDQLAQLPDPVEELKRIGMALQNAEDIETEVALWQVSVDMCEATKRLDTIKGAELITRVGVAISKRSTEDPHLVMKYYSQAEEIFQRSGSTQSHWYGILEHNIGVVQGQLGNADGEIEGYEKSVATYESLGMINSETYAGLLYELASAREDRGDLVGGREAFRKADAVYGRNANMRSKLRAYYAATVGAGRRERGDLAGELQAYEVAVRAHQLAGTLQADNGVAAQQNLEDARGRLKQLPDVEQRVVSRRLELLKRPSETDGSDEEEGVYLQRAGR